ncbi:hypothetical protein SERLA73DRAFT_48226 [Serpula lacrymans var. lacrymans S7.3]|uniref:Uncharacterized protein n=1 Tax=Serpula lacrymans var. lacrymans (strain S7.3) TaxID=936435 RepID=F8PM55_SERL3|nr:hypothetical protein SERLA73DRAFT_48226 [Serpula lacrymans var. lacrymans S7.3]
MIQLRLIFHWKIKILFQNEARFYFTGNCNTYTLRDEGAGFALCWQELLKILIGFKNEDQEVVHFVSDTMVTNTPA